ncbi:DUF1059 domain-containing protein [Rhodococcus rhodochrous]
MSRRAPVRRRRCPSIAWKGLDAMRAKTRLNCPCGAHVAGVDEDDLVIRAQEHLRESHPGMEYSRDEILFISY